MLRQLSRVAIAVTILVTPALAGAVRYAFDFSYPFDPGGDVVISYTAAAPTAPGDTIPAFTSDITQQPQMNFLVEGARNADGSWTYTDWGDPHFYVSFTAYTDLTFPNIVGTYLSVSAQATNECNTCPGLPPGQAPHRLPLISPSLMFQSLVLVPCAV